MHASHPPMAGQTPCPATPYGANRTMQVADMTNENHADAFLRRLLDMLGHKGEQEAETKELVEAERRPGTRKQGCLIVRKRARKRRARE